MEFSAGQTQQMVIRNFLGRFQALQGDPLTGAAAVMGISQLLVHAGRFFTAPDKDTDVDINTPKYWMLETSDNADLETHACFGVYSSQQCVFEVFEAPTVSAVGTELEVVNHNRNCGLLPDGKFYKDPTVTDDGKLLDVTGIGSTGGMLKIGGHAGESEWDLKPDTRYLLKVTVGANDTLVTLQADFTEIDPSELIWDGHEPSSSSSA